MPQLTIDLGLLGLPVTLDSSGWVEAVDSLGNPLPIVANAGTMIFGARGLDFDTEGVAVIDLVSTDELEPAGVRYRVYVTRDDATTAPVAIGPFLLTVDASLDQLAELPPADVVAAVEVIKGQVESIRDETEAAAAGVAPALDAAVADVKEISGLTGEDAAVAFLVGNTGSDTAAALSATYARGVSVTETRFAGGAIADWNGTTGTDNLAAFNAALAAAEDGDQVFIPGGRYYLSGPLVINKLVRIATGASGIQQNSPGTELVFAAGSDGLWITDDGVSAPPHGVHIDPIQITSRSTVAGSDVGIRCTNGRVTLHDVAVSGFGSHGIHLKAGADYGGGNVNLSMLHTPRVYGNRGDGIRIEGSDANHITIIRPDITGNYGWGLNFEYVSSAYVLAPHIDHQYYGSPGAIRDWGDSNVCEHVYLETGDGSSNGGKILLYRNVGFGIESRYFQATFGFYGGAFEIEDQTVAHTHIIDSASRGRVGSYRSETRNGLNTYRIDPGGVNADSYALVHTPSGGADRVVTEFYPAFDHYWFGAHAVPRVHNTWDLGENSQRWRDILAQRYVRIGSIYLRDNAGVLEKSTDGASWSAV